MSKPLPDDLLGTTDAARILECSAANVYKLIKAGILKPAVVTSSTRPVALYRRADVVALRDKRNRPQRSVPRRRG